MSAVVEAVVAVAMFLAIGGDTEEAMKPDVWRQAGLCVKQCHWSDASPECWRREKRNLPCEVNHPRAMFWDNYYQPERPWQEGAPAFYEKPLLAPEWVQSDQPTAYRGSDVGWLKLRL